MSTYKTFSIVTYDRNCRIVDDTRENGQPPKSQPTEKPTRAYNNQNATVGVFNKLSFLAS